MDYEVSQAEFCADALNFLTGHGHGFGYVHDFLLDREIMVRFDHKDLNCDTPYFEKLPPTPENFARVIREILVEALPAGMLDRIRLQPDEDTWVEIVEPGP